MQYSPKWGKIIFFSTVLHAILLFGLSFVFSDIIPKLEPEEIQEIEWVDVDTPDLVSNVPETPAPAETSPPPRIPEVEFPPLVIPTPIPEPVVQEPSPPITDPIVEKTPPPEVKKEEVKPDTTQTPGDKESEKIEDELGKDTTDEDLTKKLKVISKVYPKDIVNELLAAGIINEKGVLKMDKTIVAVTVDSNGRVRNAEIRRGGGTDENGDTINILIEAAATRWIFEPFVDSEGNTKEIKTQIEFTPEDF